MGELIAFPHRSKSVQNRVAPSIEVIRVQQPDKRPYRLSRDRLVSLSALFTLTHERRSVCWTLPLASSAGCESPGPDTRQTGKPSLRNSPQEVVIGKSLRQQPAAGLSGAGTASDPHGVSPSGPCTVEALPGWYLSWLDTSGKVRISPGTWTGWRHHCVGPSLELGRWRRWSFRPRLLGCSLPAAG